MGFSVPRAKQFGVFLSSVPVQVFLFILFAFCCFVVLGLRIYEYIFLLILWFGRFSSEEATEEGGSYKAQRHCCKGFCPKQKECKIEEGRFINSYGQRGFRGDKKQTVDVNIDDDKEGGVEFSEDERFEVIDRTDEIVGAVGEL